MRPSDQSRRTCRLRTRDSQFHSKPVSIARELIAIGLVRAPPEGSSTKTSAGEVYSGGGLRTP